MESSEQKKLAALEAKYKKTGDEMLAAQSAAGAAMRKETGPRSAAVQKLIAKGFKAEAIAFKVADELSAFKKAMLKKYVSP